MKLRSLLCGAAAASLLTVSASAAGFPDTVGHWAGASIDRWSASGVIAGYDDGRFGPDDPITRGQMAVILDRLLGWTDQAENAFLDVTGSEWFGGAVLRANAAGVLSGSGGYARPNDPITRQEAVVMLDRALALEWDGAGRTFGDEAQIGAWAREAVDTLAGLGLVTGADNGNFEPLRSITRAETLTILDRAVGGYYDQAGIYTQNSSGVAALVTAPGVTLRNLTIDGDLLIAPGAEGSETILRNVTVTGVIRVLSGREAQILILEDSSAQALVVSGTGSRVRVEDTVRFGSVTVSGSGAHIRGLDEEQQVTVAAGAEDVKVNGRPAGPGSTVTAGTDISTDLDDMEFEVDPDEGSRPAEEETTTEPGDIELDVDMDGWGEPSGENHGNTQPSRPAQPEEDPEPEKPTQPEEDPEPEKPAQPEEDPEAGQTTGSGTYRDEEGNIIVDFDDLINSGG